ncbi:DUF4238 domain-containing protein [Nocardia vulneris]|uniref:DUF4238 domain-containing protein n=1 Tax=Nocardia vulneris TaxID=1141657 RepID=UPI0030D1B94C
MPKIDEEWFQTVDRLGKVGSRHHVIPRFMLLKWADSNSHVWVKSKHDRTEGIRNIRDLGITDFYTFLATDGQLDATFEEVLSVVEARGATVLKRINNSFAARDDTALTPEEFIQLAKFVAFQIVRGPRRRREHELLVDWYAKTVAALTEPNRLSEDQLRTLEFAPHQNQHLELLGQMADTVTQELINRPVYLLSVDRPLFLIGDETVFFNTAGDPVHHRPECAISDEEFQRELKRARRKGRRQRDVRRLVHLYTTEPHNVEAATEIVMPISPRTLLLFGPATEWAGVVIRERVSGSDADELAATINDRVAQACLDVIVGRIDDPSFRSLPIPERAPLLAVCGSGGAARDALMSAPKRLRPRRLDRHPQPYNS